MDILTNPYIRKSKNRKKGNLLIRISKREKDYLVKNGVRFGENGIFHTIARHRRTYYLTESKRNLKLLKKYHDACREG